MQPIIQIAGIEHYKQQGLNQSHSSSGLQHGVVASARKRECGDPCFRSPTGLRPNWP